MKYLIVVALAAVAHASTLPMDTPEVAAAKAAHFAEVQRAAVAVGAPAWYPYLGLVSAGAPAVTPDGFIADTPEVQAAKSAHFAEKARAASINNLVPAPVAPVAAPYYYPYNYYPYSGAWAVPVVTPQGYLAETPEVAAARAAHLAEHAKAASLA